MIDAIKALCLIVFLSTASHCNGQSFTGIFTSKGIVTAGTSDKLNEARQLKNFKRDVTGLSVYNDYLYVSVRRSSPVHKDSAIWRVQLEDSEENGIRVGKSTWKEVVALNKFSETILCLTAANDTIYAGRTDGVIWRCPVSAPSKCAKLSKYDSKVTGIDYNPTDGKIYASTKNGLLVRCLDTPNSCQEIYKFNNEVTTVKIVFGSLWVGIKSVEPVTNKEFGELWKCTESPAGVDCKVFAKFNRNSLVSAIGATDKYMFVNVLGYRFIWFCDPLYMQSFCFRGKNILNSPAIDKFIIV